MPWAELALIMVPLEIFTTRFLFVTWKLHFLMEIIMNADSKSSLVNYQEQRKSRPFSCPPIRFRGLQTTSFRINKGSLLAEVMLILPKPLVAMLAIMEGFNSSNTQINFSLSLFFHSVASKILSQGRVSTQDEAGKFFECYLKGIVIILAFAT